MEAFHTFRVRHPKKFILEDFELFTLAISALEWRRYNGKIKLVTDTAGAEYLYKCGLNDVWDNIDIFLDEINYIKINEDVFWAGAKIYALSRQKAPCVMMDLDFILWKTIEFTHFKTDLAVIHREDINPSVYPSSEFFHFTDEWNFPTWLDWSVRPCNGALVYFGSNRFLREYTSFALEFMQKSATDNDYLSYMVFAEQRWMAMCAEKLNVTIHELSSMEGLFDRKQKYFTHIWGYKQKMRDNPKEAHDFCRMCAGRLAHDFPEFTEIIKKYDWAVKYFDMT